MKKKWFAFNWDEECKNAETKRELLAMFWLFKIRKIVAGQYELTTDSGRTWFIYNSLESARQDGWDIDNIHGHF